jgi:hypothetical protein
MLGTLENGFTTELSIFTPTAPQLLTGVGLLGAGFCQHLYFAFVPTSAVIQAKGFQPLSREISSSFKFRKALS